MLLVSVLLMVLPYFYYHFCLGLYTPAIHLYYMKAYYFLTSISMPDAQTSDMRQIRLNKQKSWDFAFYVYVQTLPYDGFHIFCLIDVIIKCATFGCNRLTVWILWRRVELWSFPQEFDVALTHGLQLPLFSVRDETHSFASSSCAMLMPFGFIRTHIEDGSGRTHQPTPL